MKALGRRKGKRINKTLRDEELMASCRGCKTLETLWFRGKTMVPTRKFVQRRGQVYHDCGAGTPCLLIRR